MEFAEMVLNKAAGRIENVDGSGLEALKEAGPKILATTHLTDFDTQMAAVATLPLVGGFENVTLVHSSNHRSGQRPEMKLLYNVVSRLVPDATFRPVSHAFSKLKIDGDKVTAEPGRINPSEWSQLDQDLKAGKTVLTAAYFDDRSYFKLPESTGLLPLILKHKEPSAQLLPVATIFPKEAYEKQQHFPMSKPEIKVGAPVQLEALTWSGGEAIPIQSAFPDFTGQPIDFFEKYLSLSTQERRGLSEEQADILRSEFHHIKAQLRNQSKIFMQKFKELMPHYLQT